MPQVSGIWKLSAGLERKIRSQGGDYRSSANDGLAGFRASGSASVELGANYTANIPCVEGMPKP